MHLPTLYSRTSGGSIQQWGIEVIGSTYRTNEGIQNGKITTSTATACIGKNGGKKNETTAEQQAQKEAQAIWKKKLDSGYFENVGDIDQQKFFEPMLAHKYGEHPTKFPCFAQPKLDGIRCLLKQDGMWSRNGKRIVSAPHIYEAVKHLFKQWPDLVLDGELYCNKLKEDFNKICSLVKKSKPTKEDLEESKNTVQYWVYDIPSDKQVFQTRTNDLKFLFEEITSDCIVFVETHEIGDQEQLDHLYEKWISEGYEGQMVRSANGTYENKRSKNLLKRKEFQDAEFEILDVGEGEGNKTGMAGYMSFKTEDGKPFHSNIKGPHTLLRQYLRSRRILIGRKATVKYFNLTPDGIPRFPYVIAIRDYE